MTFDNRTEDASIVSICGIDFDINHYIIECLIILLIFFIFTFIKTIDHFVVNVDIAHYTTPIGLIQGLLTINLTIYQVIKNKNTHKK